ncbi:MAG: hypothetical protein SFW67_28800 [Myxococcaceae bacterium]|nr:hypothetical protein [Myxococcaceae bacterium]
MSRAGLVSVLTVMAVTPACSCLMTDAQRAKKEREQVEHELKTSLTLLPYRVLKLSVRSSKSPNRPEALDGLLQLIAETQALPEKPATPEEVQRTATTWARLAKAVWDTRQSMMTRDEDEFPTFAELYTGAPLPAPYDVQLEHLALAAFWFIVDSADRGHKVPGSTQYVFYELMRAEPRPYWPNDARVLAQLLRGGAFCATEKHYAAEEELTSAITVLEAMKADELLGWGDRVSKDETLHGGRAAGYFLRAWNRMGLGRDDTAADDLEKGLGELQTIGVDNELTQWGWAFVHARRERPEKAAEQLDKLAQSPNLDPKTRAELADAATDLRASGKGIPLLLKTRAMVIIGQAMLARAGGLEAVLEAALGKEKAQQLLAPMTWLRRAREQLATSPGQVVDQGKALGAKGLELLKDKVQALQAGDAGR